MVLFEPDDFVGLSEKLFKLIIDKDYRDRLEIASLELAKFKFSSENIAKQLNELYRSLL